jgi:putative spermidine/putrescine transport system permease protein
VAVARQSLYRSRRIKLQLFRGVTFLLAAVFFLVPIIAMLEFSTRGIHGERTLEYWRSIFSYPDLVDFNFGPAPTAAIDASLELALVTSLAMLVLLVPTMVWVRLKLRRLSRILEFICLLPLTIPAIVLVVGLAPLYNHWLSTYVSDSILTLALAYVVLVLPYCYRALDAGLGAIDVKTLSEAARSLGASWFSVMWRIIVPNISNAILNATLLSVALVLGEYTIANNLLYNNLQVELVHLARANAGVSIAIAVASLLFAFVLLIAISLVGGRPRRMRSEAVTNFGTGPVQGSAG